MNNRALHVMAIMPALFLFRLFSEGVCRIDKYCWSNALLSLLFTTHLFIAYSCAGQYGSYPKESLNDSNVKEGPQAEVGYCAFCLRLGLFYAVWIVHGMSPVTTLIIKL
ncbi:MAG: hypothetical protein CO187_03570 [Zetaproteobacteria bacterium CG_4_9_14_3_um_filter_53_7]|nr:MAG: hypothetical protein CO187_03570 [Zetaproteobacteria bacterium CG_4_9_14_3_um_filter_53_7]